MTESYGLPTLDLTEGARFGFGFRDTLPVTAVGPGVPTSIQFDNQYIVRLLSVSVTLVTSVAVASRQVSLTCTDQNGNPFWVLTQPAPQAASLTEVTQFINQFNTVYTGFAAATIMNIPDILLPRNAKLTINAVNLQAADQISVTPIFVEKYPYGKSGYPAGTHRIDYS